mmetsp:Transcript_44002/g.102913  ORF Transcript_44002/g.102913 Transcript_44002/m.102913 type:complete len:220 (+) Transcript_44002:314-973(+)
MYSRQSTASSTEMGGIGKLFLRTTCQGVCAKGTVPGSTSATSCSDSSSSSPSSSGSCCVSRLDNWRAPNTLRGRLRSLYLRSFRPRRSESLSRDAYMSSPEKRTRMTCLSEQRAVTSAMCASRPWWSWSCSPPPRCSTFRRKLADCTTSLYRVKCFPICIAASLDRVFTFASQAMSEEANGWRYVCGARGEMQWQATTSVSTAEEVRRARWERLGNVRD